MRAAVIIGCALLLLLAWQPVQAQTPAPATPTPTATPTGTPEPPTVTPTGTPQPTATPYIIPVLPTITTSENMLDLLPAHGSAISESATSAGFPLLVTLIWLIGWFGLLWLVRR